VDGTRTWRIIRDSIRCDRDPEVFPRLRNAGRCAANLPQPSGGIGQRRKKRVEATVIERKRPFGRQDRSAAEFLELSEPEAALVELKLALVAAVRAARRKRRMSQIDLAQRMRSSQSRIAKIEAGDASVSLDLIVRALIAAGASRRDLARALIAID
jgi:DNA-binding XRE family transcriptional regulator